MLLLSLTTAGPCTKPRLVYTVVCHIWPGWNWFHLQVVPSCKGHITEILGGYHRSFKTSLRVICPYGHPDCVFSSALIHIWMSFSGNWNQRQGTSTLQRMCHSAMLNLSRYLKWWYSQEYYRKQRTALGLQVCRERARLTASSPAGAIWSSFWWGDYSSNQLMFDSGLLVGYLSID